MKLVHRMALILAAGVSLASFAVWSVRFAAWPWVINKGEGVCLWSAVRILEGGLPYPDPSQPPFALCAYPIGYPVLAAAFVAAFGKGLLGLRILTVIGEVAVAGAGAAILARRDGRLPALAWGAVLLGMLSVHKFHAVARVDLPALALAATAVACLARFVDGRRTGLSLVATAAACAGAVLIKPTVIVTLVAAAGWAVFALRREGRDLARLAAAVLAGAAAWATVTAAAQAASGGQYLFQTMELHTLKGAGPSAWIWKDLLDRYLPVAVAGVVAMALPADPLLKLLAVAGVVWGTTSSRAEGSDLNYTLEPLVWTVLLVGSAVSELGRRADRAAGALPAAARALGAIVLVAMLLPLRPGPVRAPELSPQVRAEGAALDRLMAETVGATLSEEPFFAVMHDKELLVTDPFGLRVLAAAGRVDLGPVVSALEERRIARVFLGADLRANAAITDVLRRRYEGFYVTEGKLADTRWMVLDPGPASPAGP